MKPEKSEGKKLDLQVRAPRMMSRCEAMYLCVCVELVHTSTDQPGNIKVISTGYKTDNLGHLRNDDTQGRRHKWPL